MTIEDFNAKGLGGSLTSRMGDFWNYWLNFGVSNKDGSGRGGRGIGRVTFLIASQIRTVLGYWRAQEAIARLKSAIHLLLTEAPRDGLKNSEIGRSLGIYMGHVEHEGHIPRTLLAMMEAEGVVEQDEATKAWRLVDHSTHIGDKQ